MLFRKRPRKKIFLTNIHYDCFDLLNYWLDAVALPALVSQHVAVNNRVANILQAAIADGRGMTFLPCIVLGETNSNVVIKEIE